MNNRSDKILIRGVNWIGDAVMTLPAVRSIRKAFPESGISILVKPWVAEIFKGNPDIDEIILYDDRFKGLFGKLRLARHLRSKKFSRAFLLQNAFDAALLSWLARIPERIGYKRDSRGLLLTNAIPVTEDILNKHQVYYYQNILEASDISTVKTRPYIFTTDSEKQWARNILNSYFPKGCSPLIGINPGATYGSAKRWPPEYFAELIIKIINELDGNVVIFGSPSEVNIANDITSEINKIKIEQKIEKFGAQILVMSGKTTLRELAVMISECDAFITNDSGPMHMASALLVPTAAIFGSTKHTETGPYGEGHKIITKNISCAPCMKRKCPEGHLKCMTEISANEVFNTLKEILPRNRAIFLDKDGTIIEDKNYLNSFKGLKILTGSKKSLQSLKENGFRLMGITNQSGIARGIVDEKFVRDSNSHLEKKLGIDDFFYCPHHPDDKCACRKPEPMMMLEARLKHHIDFRRSYVIGDKESDVLLAEKTGATGILISSTPLFEKSSAAYIARDLTEAAEWILDREKTAGQ